MNITATIKILAHKPLLQKSLKKIDFEDFDINKVPTSCIINDKEYSFAISRWVSPKRTRSYPFERVYNTWHATKKITVIPIIKDEGIKGDRDFIQWDTVSLMSLLDVYVIFAFYSKAELSSKPGKITNQQFDNEFIKYKIREIEKFHLSALHWNLHELDKSNFYPLINRVKQAYISIEKHTRVKLHDLKGIDKFSENIQADTSIFMNFSRDKALKAQEREVSTIQPKESLTTITKAKITITNFLGGQYFFTVDEVEIDLSGKKVLLIEDKHSISSKLPSKADIKDGLLKMALYSNLSEVYVDNKIMEYIPVLSLTSPNIIGEISSKSIDVDIEQFIKNNKFNNNQILIIKALISGARENNFTISIKFSK